jgi:hypothetical protein
MSQACGASTKPTLLLYLSVTCAPCRELIRALPEAIHRFGPQIEMVVVVRGNPSEVKEIVAGLPRQVIACADREGELISAYSILVTPFALSLDRRGVLRYKGVPGSDIDNLAHFVSPLLRDERRQDGYPTRETPIAMLQQV